MGLSRVILTVINDLTYDQRMQRICRSLSEDGYDVVLVGRKLRESIPLSEETFRQKRLRLFFRKGKMFYLEYNIRLFFFLLFKPFDIICGIDLDTLLPCYFASVLRGKKCVYDAHELFPEVPEVMHRPFTKKVWTSVEQFLVKRISNCYTVSAGLAEYFTKRYERRFEVIRNVPVLQDYAAITVLAHKNSDVKRTDPSFIIYQGALNEGRGLERMIDAMNNIPMKLVLAGDGDISKQLHERVKEKQLESKVEFVGKKNPADLRHLTKQSYIGINLLENRGLSYYYSLANKFFDSIHAGIPMITMNFPEYRELNRQYEVAILLDDLLAENIVQSVNKMIDDKDYYFRLRENCFRARLEWNWQRESKKLLLFYHNLR